MVNVRYPILLTCTKNYGSTNTPPGGCCGKSIERRTPTATGTAGRVGLELSIERRTALQRSYHTISTKGQRNTRRLAEFFTRNGQGLLPMVDLIGQSRLAVDELIDVAGRATIEAVLQLSAEQVAGPRTQGCGAPAFWGMAGKLGGYV